MPTGTPKLCRHAGCGGLGVSGGYCEQHKGEHWHSFTASASNQAIAFARRIRNTAQWRKVARLHKALNPLCCDPWKLHGSIAEAATSTHHIIPLAKRPDLAFVFSNLASVCESCHVRLDQAERKGLPTAHLFATYPAKQWPCPPHFLVKDVFNKC